MLFSIIIPVKKINNYILENVKKINQANFKNLEILILPDKSKNKSIESKLTLKIISTSNVRPGLKRDIGAKHAKGKFLVFLDDDSYPSKNYFKNLKKIIDKKKYKAFGGPAQTPENNSFFQKVSGAVYISKFSGGNPDRYLPGKVEKLYDDWPSVNLVVEKKLFDEIGGYGNNYWPGEDTFLCNKIKKKKKIFYSPQLLVWHHRRTGFIKHLIQVSAYGLHRGFFAKTYPENSFKIKYFLPSIFVISIIFIILGGIFINKNILYLSVPYLITIGLSYLDILKVHNYKIAAVSLVYIFFTHIFYGINFLGGFFKKKI